MVSLSSQQVYEMLLNHAYGIVRTYPKLKSIDPEEFARVGLAIAKTENHNHVPELPPNKYGATGLMQVKPIAKKQVEKYVFKIPEKPLESLLDATYNSYMAMGYLAYQYDRYGENWKKGIFSYHDGHYNSDSTAGNKYFDTVQKYYNQFDYDTMRSQISASSNNESGNITSTVFPFILGIALVYLFKKIIID